MHAVVAFVYILAVELADFVCNEIPSAEVEIPHAEIHALDSGFGDGGFKYLLELHAITYVVIDFRHSILPLFASDYLSSVAGGKYPQAPKKRRFRLSGIPGTWPNPAVSDKLHPTPERRFVLILIQLIFKRPSFRIASNK